jgi:DNA-binding response OmpR family regulator
VGKSSDPRVGVFALHARRAGGRERLTALSAAQPSTVLRTPDFEIDLLDRCVRFVDGEEVRFTPRQWQLLWLLIRATGRRVTAADLAVELFGDDAAEEAHQIPVLMLQLRRKLEPDWHAPRYVRSVDAETYMFDLEGGADPRPLGSVPRA